LPLHTPTRPSFLSPDNALPARNIAYIPAVALGILAAALFIGWPSQPEAAVLPSPTVAEGAPPEVPARSQKLPLYFVENQGQIDSPVAYYAQRQGFGVYFAADGVSFSFERPTEQGDVSADLRPVSLEGGRANPQGPRRWGVKMEFIGADADVRPVGGAASPTVVSYFTGPRSEWTTGLSTYSSILYRDVWPGIDLSYAAEGANLKYEFVVRPGARPEQIQLAYSGAVSVEVNGAGQLEVSTPLGGFVDDAPYTYQEIDGEKVEVSATYAMNDGHGYGFDVGGYDPSRPLVIDPLVAYGGYIGGAGTDFGNAVAVDASGAAYVTGSTSAPVLPPVVGPDVTPNGGQDAFVAKVNPQGTALVYVGYIGGAGSDSGNSIAVDAFGNAYVTGQTASIDLPVSPTPGIGYSGATDGFIVKVDSGGTAVLYAHYLGGAEGDQGHGIAVDASGNAYVAGTFGSDAILWKVSAAGNSLTSKGIGGAEVDEARGVAVDAAGNIYVVGQTSSTEATFGVIGGVARTPQTASWDLTFGGGSSDAFVAKVDPLLTQMIYFGYIGDVGDDSGLGIAVDPAGNAAVAGRTSTALPGYPNRGGADLFAARVNAAGTTLDYAFSSGGAAGLSDELRSVAVNPAGDAFFVGTLQMDSLGDSDAFVMRVTPSGSFSESYSLGGDGYDFGGGIALDAAGNVFVAGVTSTGEASFLRADPNVVIAGLQTWDISFNGSLDAFLVKVFSAQAPVLTSITTTSVPTTSGPVQMTLAGTGFDPPTVEVMVGSGLLLVNELLVSATPTELVLPPIGFSSSGDFPISVRNGANGPMSNSLNLTVAQPLLPTTISLSTSPNPSALGQPVTLRAQITPAVDAPIGLVSFYDGATFLGSSPAGLGTAVLTTSRLPSGTRSLRAYLTGTAAYAPSSSAAVAHTVTANPGDGLAAGPTSYLTGTGPVDVTAADFNLDGILDLAVANRDADSVSVLLGAGGGAFQQAINLASGSQPTAVAAADMNGDRNPDLVVVSSASAFVSVYPGNGNGSFQTAANYDTGLNPGSLAIGDFNLDGYPDLAVSKTNAVGVLLGMPGGELDRVVRDYPAGPSPTAPAVGDFDRDGIPDLAVANVGGSSVSVLRGDGTGAFESPTDYPVGTSPLDVAVLDFNSDGVSDLAVANIGSNDVTVLAGVADGAFFNYGTFGVGTSPGSVATADFNADGIADLVAGNRNSNDVSVLLGTNGQFQPAVNYPTRPGPRAVAPADLNGDGRVDVAVAEFGGGTVSVLFGKAPLQAITVSTSALTFSAPAGGAPKTQEVVLALPGGGTVNFAAQASANDGGDWLSVSPVVGTVGPDSTVLTVTGDPSGLMPGTYFGSITIEQGVALLSPEGAPTQGASPITVVVALEVTAADLTLSAASTDTPTLFSGVPFELTVEGAGFDPNTIEILILATSGEQACCSYTLTNAELTNKQPTLATGTATIPEGQYGLYTVEVRNGPGTPSVGGTFPIQIVVAPVSPPVPLPTFTAEGVVHAATFQGGGIAPGQIISIFGENLGPTPGVGAVIENGALTKRLGGARVDFGVARAALFFASANQLNVQASYSIAGKDSVEMTIFRDGFTGGDIVTVPVVPSAPGFFTANGSLIALKADGSLITTDNPAMPGEVVVLWATGGGQTSPPGVDGALSMPPFPKPILPSSVTIGGQPVQIAFIGMAPGFAGLLQINVVLGEQTGEALPVELKIGDAVSQPGMTVIVR